MKHMLLLTCWLLIFAMPAWAQVKRPSLGEPLTASEMAAFTAMTEDDAPPTKLSDIKYFSFSPWPKAPQPGWAVAAMGSAPDNFDVAVLKPKGDDWEIVAITNSINDPAVEPADATTLSNVTLDTIPYRIGKNDFAFGVRVSTLFNSTSTIAASTSLHLFNLQDGQLAEVFAADVDYYLSNKNTAEDKDSPSTLTFVQTQHDGHYDIVVKPNKGSTGKTLYYVWKDQHYVGNDAPQSIH